MHLDKVILGIDPGLNGALAFIRGNEIIEIIDIESKESRIDAHYLSSYIKKHSPDLAICEMVNAMPGQGVSSMFTFGHALGAITGVLAALEIPTSFVRPANWQKHFEIKISSKDKAAHKQEIADRALELYPGAPLYGPRGGLRDGRSDALLIASFLSEVGPEALIPKPKRVIKKKAIKPKSKAKIKKPSSEIPELSLYIDSVFSDKRIII